MKKPHSPSSSHSSLWWGECCHIMVMNVIGNKKQDDTVYCDALSRTQQNYEKWQYEVGKQDQQ